MHEVEPESIWPYFFFYFLFLTEVLLFLIYLILGLKYMVGEAL